MDQDKPILNLSLSEEDKDKIMNGATHIAITVQKQEGIAYGYVKEIGTEEECQNSIMPGFVVIPDEIEYVGEYIWETGDIRQMIEAERS